MTGNKTMFMILKKNRVFKKNREYDKNVHEILENIGKLKKMQVCGR